MTETYKLKRKSEDDLDILAMALIGGIIGLFILLIVGMWIDSYMFNKEVRACQQIVETNKNHSLCKEILENHSIRRIHRK